MRRCALWLTAIAGFLVITGCPTLDNLPVDLGDLEVIYISPANNDGIQDTVAISSSDVPLERTRLSRYSVNSEEILSLSYLRVGLVSPMMEA